MAATSEREAWQRVLKMIRSRGVSLGSRWAFDVLDDPKRLAFILSRYKFAAKMAAKGKRVLELGSGEGIGAPILAEFARSYVGVDRDAAAVRFACRNFGGKNVRFIEDDFLGKTYGVFDAVVCLDTVEQVKPAREGEFWRTAAGNLSDDGVLVVGARNRASASGRGRAGRANLFDGERLKGAMDRHFHGVFLFGMSDEVVHAGFVTAAPYLLALGCMKK